MAKPNLLTERIVYKPFEYPKAADYWLKQNQAHWIHTEVPMMSDINDWKQNLTKTEKNIIGSILKGFAQTETVVNDYWTGLVTKWFRKPEIIAMATVFGAMETIHAEAYSLLNEELGLDDFSEFLEDEATMAKIEALTDNAASFGDEVNWHERAKSLAIFSAFTEGVNLFSSFAVLLSFKLRNKLTPSVNAENTANDFALSCQLGVPSCESLTAVNASILAIVASSSKNSLKSSKPNSSFNKE